KRRSRLATSCWSASEARRGDSGCAPSARARSSVSRPSLPLSATLPPSPATGLTSSPSARLVTLALPSGVVEPLLLVGPPGEGPALGVLGRRVVDLANGALVRRRLHHLGIGP